MELTSDQTLRKGFTAHKEAKLQGAKRIYGAILQAQPEHPDPNHSLGLLAMTVGKPLESVTLFKLALLARTNAERFWLSCINVIMKLERFDAVRQVLVEAKRSGVSSTNLAGFHQRLRTSPIKGKGRIRRLRLSEKRKKLAEKKKNKKLQRDSINAEPSQDQISLLLDHYQSGSYTAAEALAASLAQQFPNHSIAWKVLGAVLMQTGRVAEALLPMQKSVALSEKDAEAHTNLGVALIELGKANEAEASHRQAIALNPDHAEAHNNLGVTLQRIARLEKAEESYRQAIALRPGYAEAHYNLGNSLLEQRRLDEAESTYRKTIALKPDYAEAHYNLGNTLKKLRRLNETESSYKKAIDLKPNYAEAYNNLALALQELGRLGEAESSLRQAISINPDYAEAYCNLGNALKASGRLSEAESSYKQAIVLEPRYAEAYGNMGITLKELGRLSEAESSYKQAILLKPDYADAHSNLGNTLIELGRLKEAAESYTQAAALRPEDSSAKHLVDALSGNTTESAPLGYVEKLFDGYASKFERDLVDNLDYKIPKVIAEVILKDCSLASLGSVIDLGCGTGLLGAEVRQFCRRLSGLDLSQNMLDEARKRNIYDELIKQDIVTYLKNSKLNFDYLIAADVFIYLGDLNDVFNLIKSRNKAGGKLVFSTENYDGDGFFLEKSGRYSHSKSYIEGLCEKFSFKLCHFKIQPLRKEKNKYISGGVYILDF